MSSKTYNFNFEWEQEATFQLTNFGFGTSNPQKQVDVEGDIRVSGDLYKNNSKLGHWEPIGSNQYYNKGFVGINTDPQYDLDVNGSIRSGDRLFNSDIRLKENIIDETLGIDYITTLVPKTFSYNNDSSNAINHGLIAQDIFNTSNIDCIRTDFNGFYNIDYSSLIGPIIKAIQELAIKKQNYNLI
jgi:hypothetical protein